MLHSIPFLIYITQRQIRHYIRSNPEWLDLPEWYETRRKTTHVIFWQ